ncbi:MAG: hypothetical protein ACOCWZ_01365 [Spirochaetota bacterium]
MIQLLSKKTAMLMLPMLIVIISCSPPEMEFQNNNPDPDYYLFGLLEDYPALDDAFHDVDQNTFNTLMADGVNVDLDCTVDVLPITPEIIDPLTALLGDARSILGRVIYQDQGDHPDDPYNYYAKDFYAFSDDLASFTAGSAEDITEILRKSMGYIEYSHVDDVEDVMADLSTLLRDPDMASLLDELQETGGKLLLQANGSMGYQDIDLDLGNATRGMDALLSGLRDISSNDAAARQRLFDILREMNDLFAVKVGPANKKFNDVIRDLLINIEDYATIGGSQYQNPAYSQDDNGIYVNTELRNGIREMWPSLVSLFIKAKAEWESEDLPDWSVIHDPENGESVMEYLSRQLYMLKENCNIDIGDPNNTYGGGELERSLRRMVTYNAYGERRGEASYRLSYLDHMLFTLASSYDFGYKTKVGGSHDEPYANDGDGKGTSHTHGESTDGIITLNDSLYSMTNGAKHADVKLGFIPIINKYYDAYKLCLDYRLSQGDYIYRSSEPFTKNEASQYKFYMGYDFPTLCLMSGFSAGDAGIPNGGVSAFRPGANTTSGDDYKTYYPKVANGLGELNTGRWTMGWIARACWEGEGPYYYNPEKAGKSSEKAYYDIDNDGSSESCYVYRRPDGKIYAYVHKPDGDPQNWTYFYPAEGNEPIDEEALGQRANRYHARWHTDYYLLRSDYSNNHENVRYYSPASTVEGTDYLMHAINDPQNDKDDDDASTNTAGCLWYDEVVPEGSSVRECASQEEAMYRNFQWLMLEKKFVFVIPMRSYVNEPIGLDICPITRVHMDSPVITIIEANGVVGLAEAKKGSQNGYWVKKKAGGQSTLPADARIEVYMKEDAAYMLGAGDKVNVETIWNDILGSKNVLPDAVGRNIAPIARMAFLEEEYITSSSPEIGSSSSNTWYNRNKLFPLVAALAGNLHQKSYYDAPASGHDYNHVGSHRYPLKVLRDLIHMLGQPLIRHYDEHGGRWMPVVNEEYGHGSYAQFAPDGYGVDHRPTENLRTVISVLTEDGSNEEANCDGLVPALAETNMVTKLMAFLQTTGDTSGVYADVNKTSDDYTQWGARRKVFYGLEQVFTTIKCSEGTATSRGYFDVYHPEWMFTMRDVDVNLDGLLDELIGYSDPDPNNDLHGKGLAVFVDNRTDSNPNRNWDNYYKLTEGIGELLSKKGSTSGEYCITDNLVNVLESTLSSFNATDEQLKGVRHTLGSVFTEYDDAQGKWVYPQDLKNILTVHLPEILDAYQGHHQNLVYFANTMLMKDGFVEYLMKTLDSRYPAEDVYTQLHAFLGNELVCLPDSPLWCDLNELLISFVDMMIQQNGLTVEKSSLFEETVYMPEVAPTAKYDSYNIDPYTALGEILSK